MKTLCKQCTQRSIPQLWIALNSAAADRLISVLDFVTSKFWTAKFYWTAYLLMLGGVVIMLGLSLFSIRIGRFRPRFLQTSYGSTYRSVHCAFGLQGWAGWLRTFWLVVEWRDAHFRATEYHALFSMEATFGFDERETQALVERETRLSLTPLWVWFDAGW